MPTHVRSCTERRVISRQLRSKTPRHSRMEIQSALLILIDPVQQELLSGFAEQVCGLAAVPQCFVRMPRAVLFDRPGETILPIQQCKQQEPSTAAQSIKGAFSLGRTRAKLNFLFRRIDELAKSL